MLQILLRQKSSLEEQIRNLRAQIAVLEGELKDVNVACRVVAGLSGPAIAPDVDLADLPTKNVPSTKKKGTPKPPNTPPTADMALYVLYEALSSGVLSMSTAEIVRKIEGKWWFGVTSGDVTPNIIRLIARGHVDRLNGTYQLTPAGIQKAEELLGTSKML